ncbi:hypothetical protein Tco_0982495, partial [Tanacetum coccineum]
TDAKFRSIDGGFVTSVVGGGVGVDFYNGGVKDGNDCGMMVVYIGEDLVITETGISKKFKSLDAKSDKWEELVIETSVFCGTVESVT